MAQVLTQATRAPANRPNGRGRTPDGLAGVGFVQWIVAALLVGSGVVHFALAAPHFGEATALGAGFLLAGWAQIGLAVAVVLRPSRAVLSAIIVVSAACIAAWAVSRTSGLPFGAGAGHSENVTVVDGMTVAMEGAAIALTALLFSSVVRRYRASSPALVIVFGILMITSALIASPSARAHGGAAHVDAAVSGAAGATAHDHAALSGQEISASASSVGAPADTATTAHAHDIAAEATPDVPLDPATRAQLADQLTIARQVALQFPTAASAEAAGYHQVGGYFPGTGAHYVGRNLTNGVFDASKPLALLYDGTSPTSQIVGVMYYSLGATAPEGFAGPNDHWHRHSNACTRGATVLSRPDSDITQEQCTALGGNFTTTTGWMVHAWVVPSWESPLGVFSHENPNLLCGDGTLNTDTVGRCQGT